MVGLRPVVHSLPLVFGPAALWLATTMTAAADEPQPYTSQVTHHLTATVQSIDPQTRTVALVGPSGEREEFSVDPAVRNLAQVKPGDRVVLTYYVGVAAQVRPPGTQAQAPLVTQQMTTAPAGAKPSGRLTRTINMTVKIESIDDATNTVKFRRADGTVDTVAVEDPAAQQRVRQLKPGDAVELTFTEATAVDVQPTRR